MNDETLEKKIKNFTSLVFAGFIGYVALTAYLDKGFMSKDEFLKNDKISSIPYVFKSFENKNNSYFLKSLVDTKPVYNKDFFAKSL